MINAVLLPAVKCFACVRSRERVRLHLRCTFACVQNYATMLSLSLWASELRGNGRERERERASTCKYAHAHTTASSLILLDIVILGQDTRALSRSLCSAFQIDYLFADTYTHCQATERHQHFAIVPFPCSQNSIRTLWRSLRVESNLWRVQMWWTGPI